MLWARTATGKVDPSIDGTALPEQSAFLYGPKESRRRLPGAVVVIEGDRYSNQRHGLVDDLCRVATRLLRLICLFGTQSIRPRLPFEMTHDRLSALHAGTNTKSNIEPVVSSAQRTFTLIPLSISPSTTSSTTWMNAVSAPSSWISA